MARVLVTGMSGAGKSTVLDRLAERGHRVVDTDHDGWTLPDGTWDVARVCAHRRSTGGTSGVAQEGQSSWAS